MKKTIIIETAPLPSSSYDGIIREALRRHHQVNQPIAPDSWELLGQMSAVLLPNADDDGAGTSQPLYRESSRKKRRRRTGESEVEK